MIEFKGEVFKLNGLCDSGNLLKEPISGKNVILISKNTKLGQIIEKEQEIKKRYVPYNVVNGEGVLKGII
ncbi:MAG: sigma-E processing peptidase SpoIIGA, partial [Clostridia bacterium]|nr:sigma-E processing peptidase SpoIIGA [Clostridia bacterium]